MTRRSARIAAAVVRAWTRLYTWGLPREERLARRAEIASDLWEQLEGDPRRSDGAIVILVRLIFGIRDDVAWRAEHSTGVALLSLTTAVAAALAIVLMVVFAAPAPPDAPPPPTISRRALPAPPPQPPPPCNPPAVPQLGRCTPY